MMLLEQDKKTNCGQTTVAMLTNLTLSEIEALYGHDKASDTREAMNVLEQLGYKHGKLVKVDNRKKGDKVPKGKMAFVRIKFGNRTCGHFMAFDGEKFYDPNGLIYDNEEAMLDRYNTYYKNYNFKVYVSHYFTVEKGE